MNNKKTSHEVKNEQLVTYRSGEIIFEEGDEGGDMYMIKEGDVEVFTEHEGTVVVLSKMSSGEILGTLASVTRENRLASARAASFVTLSVISREAFAKKLSALPVIVNIVFKEFSKRLVLMNQRYSTALATVRDQSLSLVNALHTSAQLASAISSLAQMRQEPFDEERGLLPKSMIEFCAKVLNHDEGELAKIFQVFVECGLITLKIEQEKKRKYFTVDNAEKIADYCHFVQQAKRKKIRHILEVRLKQKELRAMFALSRYLESQNLAEKTEVSLTEIEIESKIEQTTGFACAIEDLKTAQRMGLVDMNEPDEGQVKTVRLSPKKLSHTLTHINVYRSLNKINLAELSKKSET